MLITGGTAKITAIQQLVQKGRGQMKGWRKQLTVPMSARPYSHLTDVHGS
jgi:hypothetical protein